MTFFPYQLFKFDQKAIQAWKWSEMILHKFERRWSVDWLVSDVDCVSCNAIKFNIQMEKKMIEIHLMWHHRNQLVRPHLLIVDLIYDFQYYSENFYKYSVNSRFDIYFFSTQFNIRGNLSNTTFVCPHIRHFART